MRDAFFRALADLGAADERVWALTGDLGLGLFEPFEAVASGRYLNVGIAEQTLVGVAAGLAYAGKVPVRLLDRPVRDVRGRTTRCASTSPARPRT